MRQFFAIAIYRCLVSGESEGALDFQVRYLVANSEEEIRRHLEGEQRTRYLNADGKAVEWELRAIMAVEEVAGLDSGAEVVGFIADQDEIRELA